MYAAACAAFGFQHWLEDLKSYDMTSQHCRQGTASICEGPPQQLLCIAIQAVRLAIMTADVHNVQGLP